MIARKEAILWMYNLLMHPVSKSDLNQFVNNHIDEFHQNRANKLKSIRLTEVLKRKNPYLFKAKNLNSVPDLISDILNAYLSSSEEEYFGQFLEKLAIFISEKAAHGHKSPAHGVDLEFEDDGVIYLVSIKSGPNWGNAQSIRRQELEFNNAVLIRRQGDRSTNVRAVLGICYGNAKTVDRGAYTKIVGQSFWGLISGNNNLYKEIVEPIGYKAKEHNDFFLVEKNRIINLFVAEFTTKFCVDGNISWEQLVEFNSSSIHE